jgi:hypothetical protein
VLFAPKTVYNPKTQMYVMWFNYIVGKWSMAPTPSLPRLV